MKAFREAPIAVPWLGILRGDWPLVPLRYLVRFLSGGTPDKGNAEFWSGGTIPWVSPKDMKVDRINDSEDHITQAALDGSATQFVPVGSVLVVVRGMILAHTLPVAVTTGPVTINQDIKALVCGQRILPEFLHAVLAGQAEWLLSQADSSAHGTKKIETEVLQRFEVPCPPLELQRRIVATIRTQAMGLDEVVAAKRRVLDLLAEKRKAIIATAVTRGLDPKVKLRDSGVPWLGEIPAGWEVVPFRWYFRIGSGDFIATDEVVSELDAARHTPVIGGNGVAGYTAAANTSDAASIVVGRVGAQCGNVHVITGLAWVTDNALLLRDIREYEVEYLAQVLHHRDLNSIANKTAQPLITGSMVTELRGPRPPLAEQRAIVAHIARETARLDAVRAATERTILLLTERRAALIAAAVTGRLDVGAAA